MCIFRKIVPAHGGRAAVQFWCIMRFGDFPLALVCSAALRIVPLGNRAVASSLGILTVGYIISTT